MLEMVVAANVDHRRTLGLGRRKTFAPMREHFRPQLKSFVEFSFHQPSRIGKVAIVGLRNHLIASAPIKEPFTGVLLNPDWEFVPNLSNTEPLVIVSSRHFKHGEGSDLRDIFGFFDDGEFYAQFHVGETKRARTRSTRQVNGIVRREDASPREYGVQLHPRNCAPVELESWPRGVDFCRRAIDAAEDVELVVMQVDRHRIVSLIRGSLRPEAWAGQHQKKEKRQFQATIPTLHWCFRPPQRSRYAVDIEVRYYTIGIRSWLKQ